jgi:hypothetical protein
MKHYLISVPLGRDAYFHTYLMTNNKRDVEPATSKMMEEAEKMIGHPVPLPVVLMTGPLRKQDVAVVHEAVNRDPEVAKVLKRATDYHLSIWFMTNKDPMYKKLLELH